MSKQLGWHLLQNNNEMRNFKPLILCLALLLVRTTYGNQRLVVFGDSLSDNGRLFALTGSPSQPYGFEYNRLGKVVKYFPGRFTDGQNWVDYFPKVARFFGVDISTVSPFFKGPLKAGDNTTNFAVGGATSGDFNVQNKPPIIFPGFSAEIRTYLDAVNLRASTDDLYVIWIGANDFAAPNPSPQTTVDNIRAGIAALAKAGAKHFIVISIPEIFLTPEVKALPAPEIVAVKQFVAAVNVLLAVDLPLSARTGRIDVKFVDINTIFVPIVLESPFFGFSNSVGAAFDPSAPISAFNPVFDPDDYVFWDGFHPTTKVHRFAADFVFTAVFSRHLFNEFSPVQ
jgi:outer membrane lipase/esterase